MIGPLSPGETFQAEITNFPTGIASQVGTKIILVATGNEVTPRQTGAIETDPGVYFIGLTAPTLPGVYSVISDWAGGATPRPSQIAEEQLVVEAVATAGATADTTSGNGAAVTVPHFAMPPRFVNGKAIVVEQDSLEEITDCVANVCRYHVGDRPEKRDFGITDPTFQMNGPDPGVIAAQVELWEPRAAIAAARDNRQLEELVANVALTVTDKGGSS